MSTYFVTGTDTDIGKTHTVCALIRYFQSQQKTVLALKPVSTGCHIEDNELISPDVIAYRHLLPDTIRSPWAFQPPIAPHIAAMHEGITLSASQIVTWCDKKIKENKADVTLIEGAGGVLVPLNAKETWIDVIKGLSEPVIIVVGMKLGCINHALLTELALISASCQVAGWIANQLTKEEKNSLEMIESLQLRMTSPYLGEIKYSETSSLMLTIRANA